MISEVFTELFSEVSLRRSRDFSREVITKRGNKAKEDIQMFVTDRTQVGQKHSNLIKGKRRFVEFTSHPTNRGGEVRQHIEVVL